MPRDLDVIVIHWRTPDLCAALLRRLEPLRRRGARLTVVDNASGDGSAGALARAFPEAFVVRAPRNLGYAGGANYGLARTARPFVLLLNPDLDLPDPTAPERLLATCRGDPTCGAVGPALVLPDGRWQVGAAGAAPGPASALGHFLGLDRLAPRRAPALFARQAPLARAGAAVDVGWVCGAALLVRRRAVAAVGGLPAERLLYGEDLRLGTLLRRAGWRVRYEPRALFVHQQAGAQGGDPGPRWLSATLAEVERDATPAGRAAARGAAFAGLSLRAMLAAAGLGPDPGPGRAVRLWRDARAALAVDAEREPAEATPEAVGAS